MENNKDILMNDLLLLAKNFYKVVEVDLNTDSYFEVTDGEPGRPHEGLMKWVEAFIDGGGVHPEDVQRFRGFFNPFVLKLGIDKWQRVYYRRLIDNKWRYVCMEVLPLENYSDDDAIVLMVVRDVEEYIKDFHMQVGLGAGPC